MLRKTCHLFALCMLLSLMTQAQMPVTGMSGFNAKDYKKKLGLKAGVNFANVNASSNLDLKGRSGFMVGAFFAPATRSGFGFRTELIYSSQGFAYNANNTESKVAQNYIYLPQLTTYTIGKVLQLQAGMQLGFLLNAKKDNGTSQDVKSYYNHLDYGFAGGVEINPLKFLIVGSRYNVSLGNIYNSGPPTSASPFPFDPNTLKGKNSVLQFYVGCKL